ncbi:hypothetical protein [Aeromonas hydrophila]|uniref:hypothetical protein n=1 Tax=Aeromonas hydrophila TaxID=644 RepID=UPI002B47A45B|nr:hypothetical protein [Aeromonas hydrophila]
MLPEGVSAITMDIEVADVIHRVGRTDVLTYGYLWLKIEGCRDMEAELLNKSSIWVIVERLNCFIEFNSKTFLQA